MSRFRAIPDLSRRNRSGSRVGRNENLAHVSQEASRRSTGPRREPKQERSRETTAVILKAAEELLVEVGYAHASTNAIAERAGVSVGSLYQYFSGKEQVFRAVQRRHREEVLPHIFALLKRLSDPKEDIAAASVELMRALAEVHGRNPRLMRAIDGELGWLEHEDDGSTDVLPVVKGVLVERLALPTAETEAIATLLVEVVTHLSRWLVHAQPEGIALEAFLNATRRMIDGLLATKQPTRRRARQARG